MRCAPLFVVPFALLTSSCSESSAAPEPAAEVALDAAPAVKELEAKEPEAEDPAPLDVQVTAVEGALTGRLALFSVDVTGGPGGLASLTAEFLKRPAIAARWSEDGRRWRVLAGVPIEHGTGEHELRLEGKLVDGSPLVISRRFEVKEAPYETSEITVSRRFMRPSKKDRRRAAREQKSLARALAQASKERLWRGSFRRPTDTPETSPFGTLRTYNKKKRSRHLGLDLDGKVGDAIYAAQRGRAVLVEDRFYSGGTVILDHGEGLFTMYFHMSAFDVKEGDVVEKGQLLGKVGKSGRVTGPHLHFSVKMAGEYVDPKRVLALDLSGDPLEEKADEAPVVASP